MFYTFFLLIIIYSLIKRIFKIVNANLKSNIDKNYITNMTKSLFNEFNEPCLINIKDKEINDYYLFFIKRYLKETDFININNPKISIVIPVYNGKKFIIRSLLSIYAQSFKNIEIIYVDDFFN